MNRSPRSLTQRRAFAAHGFGDERHRIAPDRERGRMKLYELHVGEQRAGARRHRDAVARRLNRIRRVAVEPADSARRQERRAAATKRDAVRRPRCRARKRRRRGRRSTIRSSAVDVLDDAIDGCVRTASNQRLENLVAGRVAARFDDAPALVRGFASEREFAALGAIERCAEFEQFFDARRCVVREDLDDLFVADARAGALRVDRVQARRIVLSHGRGNAALRPIGRGADAQARLAEHGNVQRGEFERGDQAGDAGADDERVAAVDLQCVFSLAARG